MIRHDLPPLSFYTLLVTERQVSQVNGYRLSADEAKLLPTGCVSPKPLMRLLILREAIEKHTGDHPAEVREFFRVGMAHVIANGAGNFAFGPEIYRTKSKPDSDVLEHFAKHVQLMILELHRAQIQGWDEVPSEVFLDDARNLAKESLLRSNTRNVFVADDDASEIGQFAEIKSVVPVATGKLLGQVAEAEGFKIVGRELWRERLGTKVRNAAVKMRSVKVREEVLLLEKR